MDVLLVVLVIGALAAMVYAGFFMEPTWVAKDGTRFICTAATMDLKGSSLSRFRECRVAIMPDGALRLDSKTLGRRHTAYYALQGRADTEQKNRIHFVLRPKGDGAPPHLITMRLPKNSKALPALERVLDGSYAATD